MKELYEKCHGLFNVAPWDIGSGDPHKLSEDQKETIDSVVKYYGHKSSQWLTELVHLEYPWKDTRKKLDSFMRSDREITHAAMHEYYSGLEEDSDGIS